MANEKIEAFLKDLTELSKKHGIIIGGCGCCGLPYLKEIEQKDKDGSYVQDYELSDFEWYVDMNGVG